MRKNHFDMMSMMSPKGWLGGSDKSSGKLLRAECRILRADARARSWARPPVLFLFLLNVFASASRARVEEFRTLPLFSEQRKLSWLQPRSPRPLEFWSQLPGKSVVP